MNFEISCASLIILISLAFHVINRVGSIDPNINDIGELIEYLSKKYFIAEQKKLLILLTPVIVLLFIFYRSNVFFFIAGVIFNLINFFISFDLVLFSNRQVADGAKNSTEDAFFKMFGLGRIAAQFVVSMSFLAAFIMQNFNLNNKILFVAGTSFIALTNKLSGGIFTKSADVAADLLGKLEYSLPEDDPRNPVALADNVGDNVGDCAGSTVGMVSTLLIVSLFSSPNLILTGVISSFVSYICTYYFHRDIESRINFYIVGSFIFSLIASFFQGNLLNYKSILFGQSMSIIIIKMTKYFTSGFPLQKLVEATKVSAANNIITGISLAKYSVFAYGTLFSLVFTLAHYYGLSVESFVMGMLTLAVPVLNLDYMGAAIDNAGALLEMTKQDSLYRQRTDYLDSIGNTNKAATKAYAMNVSLLALSSLLLKINTIFSHENFSFHIFCLSAALMGTLIPYLISAMSTLEVGETSQKIVDDLYIRMPALITNSSVKSEEHLRLIENLTNTSANSMLKISLISFVLIFSFSYMYCILSKVAFIIFLTGFLVSSNILSLFLTTSGAMWDNAKKYIGSNLGKQSSYYKSAIIGDVVGDPFKDTAGPAIIPIIQLTFLFCLLFNL